MLLGGFCCIIENMLKVQRNKFGVFPAIFLFVFGLVFMGAGVLGVNFLQVDESWVEITGKVVDYTTRQGEDGTLYSPTVEYVVGGEVYKVQSSSASSFRPSVGTERTVAYDPKRPNDSTVVEGLGIQLLVWLFPLVGGLISIGAVVGFIFSVRRSRKIKFLVENGQKVTGVLVDFQKAGDKAYQIVVAATDPSGTVNNYVSDKLKGVAGLAMADFKDKPIPIDVYIDRQDPKNYYVDISDIPNLTPERIFELIQKGAQKVTGGFTQSE